jgi:hypothetical protein
VKHDPLRSVAHNVAASLASGCSFLVGVYDVGLDEALAASPDGIITADFLAGTIDPPLWNSKLAYTVSLVPGALEELCQRHGVHISSFRALLARFRVSFDGLRCTLIVEDIRGHRTESEYHGPALARIRSLDAAGRIRKRPVVRSPR